jgi:hypothetical protein
MINAYTFVVYEPQQKRKLWRNISRWKNNIKVQLKIPRG